MQYQLCAKKVVPEIKWSMPKKSFVLKFSMLPGSALSYEDLYSLYKLADYQFPPFESGWNIIEIELMAKMPQADSTSYKCFGTASQLTMEVYLVKQHETSANAFLSSLQSSWEMIHIQDKKYSTNERQALIFP